ncbi:fasciclin domain-containing protein [Niabella sp.]|uniref:fasciclin domain-containing protein n=1 Tax=Niabella sp. TaxID=1962976 RepID=UPI00260579E0|nr:fasciclin domain-containing protein [Niabella sp.]
MKKIVVVYILVCCTLMACLVSCKKKPDGYYDFTNKENVFNGTVYEYLKSKQGVFDSLLEVMDRSTWLKDSLSNATGRYTIFAPVNNNFRIALQNLNVVRMGSNKPPLDLKTVNAAQLDTLVDLYAVRGYYPTDSMLYVDGLYLKSIRYGDSLHAQRFIDGAQGIVNGGPVSVNFAYTNKSGFASKWVVEPTQVVNIKASNGVIHVLAYANEFGFNQVIKRWNQ